MPETVDSQEDRKEALYNQWRNLTSSNQWERAIEVLHELLSLDPESDWIFSQLGWAYQSLGKLDEAESFFKKAIAQAPSESSYFEGLAWVCFHRNKMRPAEDACRKAIELNPDDPDPWFLMASIMVQADDPEGAQRFLDNGSKLSPADGRILEIQTNIGSLDDAPNKLSPEQQLANYQRMLAKDPDSAFLHYRVGHLQLHELNQARAAEENFRQALRLDPGDSDYPKELMRAIRKRDLFLKTLWAPCNLGVWIFEKYGQLWEMRWPIVFLLFTWWAFIGPAVALLIVFLFFCWPMAKIYEVCTLVDIHKKMGRISYYSGPAAFIHKLPFKTRITLFLGIFTLFWAGIIIALQDPAIFEGTFVALGTLTVIGVRLLLLAGIVYWIWSSISKKRRKRRNRHLEVSTVSPPPLPKGHE